MEPLTGEIEALMEWVNGDDRVIIAHLGKNVITRDRESIVLTDLVEADFPGYAPVRVQNWEPRIFDDEAYGEADSGEIEFAAVNIVDAQLIYTQYLTVSSPGMTTRLWMCIPYDRPTRVSTEEPLAVVKWRVSSTAELEPEVPDSDV